MVKNKKLLLTIQNLKDLGILKTKKKRRIMMRRKKTVRRQNFTSL
jgi:hypothetical protein